LNGRTVAMNIFSEKQKENGELTVAGMLPPAERIVFEKLAVGQDAATFYLSSYFDWHRLLALQNDGQYRLLFWRMQPNAHEATDVRVYTGSYHAMRTPLGDEGLKLAIGLRGDSLGSDVDDEELILVRSGDAELLLRASELHDIAADIAAEGTMGRSEYYWYRVSPFDLFVQEPHGGRTAIPFTDLPHAVQDMLSAKPLLATIVSVDERLTDEDTVMCTLDIGEAEGLRMNMPLYSPQGSGKHLKGWVWEMTPHACRVGIEYHCVAPHCVDEGNVATFPRVGDTLTSLAPSPE